MSQQIQPQEYLRLERQSEYKSEYINGQIFAMGGASKAHNLIAGNVFGELRQQLKGRPCESYVSDMRVKVRSAGLYTYPDVVVVCGEPEFEDSEVDTLLNPTILSSKSCLPQPNVTTASPKLHTTARLILSRSICWWLRTKFVWNNTLDNEMESGCFQSIYRSMLS